MGGSCTASAGRGPAWGGELWAAQGPSAQCPTAILWPRGAELGGRPRCCGGLSLAGR